MDRVRKLTGAEPLLTKGFTGKGITAAILDSGIYPHPDLKERIIDFRDFLNCLLRRQLWNTEGNHNFPARAFRRQRLGNRPRARHKRVLARKNWRDQQGTVGRTDGGKGNLPLITLFFATQFVVLKAASAQSGAVFYFVNFFERGVFWDRKIFVEIGKWNFLEEREKPLRCACVFCGREKFFAQLRKLRSDFLSALRVGYWRNSKRAVIISNCYGKHKKYI